MKLKSDGIEIRFRKMTINMNHVLCLPTSSTASISFHCFRRSHKKKIEDIGDAREGDSIKRGTTREYANLYH